MSHEDDGPGLRLARTVEAFDDDATNIEEVLHEELIEQEFLRRYDSGGDFDGSADDDSLNLELASPPKRKGDQIIVKLLVYFTEKGSPGCRDIEFESNHTVTGILSIRHKDGHAEWEEEEDRSDWAE